MVSPSKEHLEKHYEDLSSKPFFKGLVTCMEELVRSATVADEIFRHAERSHRGYGLGRP